MHANQFFLKRALLRASFRQQELRNGRIRVMILLSDVLVFSEPHLALIHGVESVDREVRLSNIRVLGERHFRVAKRRNLWEPVRRVR